MKTIVHIGQHKTGTTSIQAYLKAHHEQLARQGVYVPLSLGGLESTNHFVLNIHALAQDRDSPAKQVATAKQGGRHLAKLARRLKKEMRTHYKAAAKQGCHTVLWSNEGLYLLNSVAEYQRLADLFRPHCKTIDVVCCFREPGSYRTSYGLHLQEKGITPSNDPDSFAYVAADSWLFDYERKRRLLADVFTQSHFFDYQVEDNVGAFFQTLGIEAPGADRFRLNVTS